MGGESDDEIGEKTIPKGKKSKANKKSSAAARRDRFKLEKESKKQKKRRERGETDDPDAARERADLELLMMNDDEVRARGLGRRHPRSQKIIQKTFRRRRRRRRQEGRKSRKERLAEKRKSRGKAARRQESDDEDDETANGRGSGANVDTADPRFSVSSSRTTSPSIPRTRGIRTSRRRMRSSGRGTGGGERRTRFPSVRRAMPGTSRVRGRRRKSKAGKAKDLELSAMVAGLKRKKVATV